MKSIFIRTILTILILSCGIKGKLSGIDRKHFVQSLIKYTLFKYFTQVLLFFLLSNGVKEEGGASLNNTELSETIQWIEDISLEIANDNYLWPVLVQNPENEDYSIDFPYKGYIIFTNPQTEDFEYIFADNVEKIKNKPFWNPRLNFLVLACGELEKTTEKIADTVLSILKHTDNVINAVLLIFTDDTNDTTENITVSAYTLFPYLNGACNEETVLLIGKWNMHNVSDETFKAVDLFPSKLPKNFMGCVLNVGAIGPEPYVIKENYTNQEGEEHFVLQGIGMELINLFVNEVNFTPKFSEPVIEMKYENILNLIFMLASGEIDIAGGCLPGIQPLTLVADASVPMYIDTFDYLVPCPQSMAKTEKIVTLFSLSTWACMGLVFIFVSILFWILSKYPAQRDAFTGFNLLAQCFSASWAILLGISVPQIPVSLHTRNLFIVYVWYCFAISTVFQAYFTTYLVEPGYEARIETLEDVMAAGLKLGSYPVMLDLQNIIDLPKQSEFQEMFMLISVNVLAV
ncbi:hypothetical protein L9F63_001144 [Diploptera punctata]|uniref:Uncharacterized protein n=1 Tax=Diploptera punctata TaxID=6984 RepID=A0AAD8A4H1_DIPPU|nr:hypothetical protein L9F63_001144 [Diploptera punctata]